MKKTHIYQIFYDAASYSQLDPGFTPLDNTQNERPEWREYWPIRKFLLSTTMTHMDYYGFFSGKFRAKTGLSSQQVYEFIEQQGEDADIISFSPFYDQSSLFLNVFEQGECWHTGLFSITQAFIYELGWNIDLTKLITDSRNTIFCNYFVAKPEVWRHWLTITEKLLAITEGADIDLKKLLNYITNHYDPVPMKTFIMERIITLLLANYKQKFRVKPYDPFLLPCALEGFQFQSILSDSLKQAYIDQGYPAYQQAFFTIRQAINETGKLKFMRSE